MQTWGTHFSKEKRGGVRSTLLFFGLQGRCRQRRRWFAQSIRALGYMDLWSWVSKLWFRLSKRAWTSPLPFERASSEKQASERLIELAKSLSIKLWILPDPRCALFGGTTKTKCCYTHQLDQIRNCCWHSIDTKNVWNKLHKCILRSGNYMDRKFKDKRDPKYSVDSPFETGFSLLNLSKPPGRHIHGTKEFTAECFAGRTCEHLQCNDSATLIPM